MSTQRKPGPGRRSKGDRTAIITRPATTVAQKVMAEATSRDLSYSEYVAIILAMSHGEDVEMPKRQHPISEQLAVFDAEALISA